MPLERQFASSNKSSRLILDINGLYGMSNEEVLLLSKLKEQYAAY